ncbi:MAG: ABC transporter permease, partial [Bacteroidota bacterium]
MRANSPSEPPVWPLYLLRKLLKSDFLEELEGDLYEVYQDSLEEVSAKRAHRRYIWDCLKLIRPTLLATPKFSHRLNSFIMLKINIKIALRIFNKNRTYTAINVLGLASALTISLLILQYVRFELSYEAYNPNAEKLIRITTDYMDGDVIFEQDCETYPPLGPLIKDEFSEVEEFARAYHIDQFTLKVGDQFFRESKMYGADASFFSMFNYPFLQGNQETAFQAPYELVLTQSQAVKLFGTEDVLNRTIEIPSDSATFKVVGIIKDSPENTHLKFSMLMSYPTLKTLYGETDDNWGGNNTFTYYQLSDRSQYPRFLANLEKLNERLTAEEFLPSENIIAQPMEDIHLYSHKSFEAETNGNANTVYFMLGVAILIILIALFNYINLSTSKALDRANEIGIRKVNGSSRLQLIGQLYTESVLVFLFAGILSVALIALFIDYFAELAQLSESWHFLGDLKFWGLFMGILTISVLISGGIPAKVISSFKPMEVLKGKFGHSASGNRLRQALVVVQFGITIFLLVQTLTVNQQLNFMRGKDLGLTGENVIVVNAPDDWTLDKFKAFKGELLQNPLFEKVALSEAAPGMPAHQMGTTTGINPADALEEHNNNMYLYFIDHDFVDVMDLQLVAGTDFIDGNNDNKVIVNQEALRIWNLPNTDAAVGKKLNVGKGQWSITGVIKDFHQFSPKDPLVPMIFIYDHGDASLINIKAVGDNPQQQVAALETAFSSYFPNTPFNFFFLDQEFDKQYQQDVRFQQVFGLLSVLAIFIACLGLFGLASFTITKRSKEIGVRKVLGASVQQIILLVSSQFMKLVGVAALIALP